MSNAVAPEPPRGRALLRAWLPAGLYMILIWAASSAPIPAAALERVPINDKLVHALEYTVLSALLAHATRRTWPAHHVLRTLSVAVLIAFGWGLLDEIHQAFVPGRSSDLLDVAADLGGAVVGALAWHGVSRLRRRR